MKPGKDSDYGEVRPLTAADVQSSTGVAGPHRDDELNRLMALLFAPTLTLVKHYLMAKNANRKTIQKCVQEWADEHPGLYGSAFALDLLFRVVAMLFVIIVFARGLGILH